MSLPPIMPVVRRIASEPLPQFIAIGLVLFGIAHVIGSRDPRAEIRVDAAQRDYQRNQFRGQFGTDPDPSRLDELLHTYVRDEVLYREALRLGLDRDDEIVRRRLIQKMEFLVAEGATVPAPTAQQLSDYQKRHAAEFAEPGGISFEHRYFADEGATSGRSRAAAALAILRHGGKVEGDVFAPGERFESMAPTDARKLFGDTPLAGALPTAALGHWEGPFQSGYGWHLLRVTARSEVRIAALPDVEDAVRDGWQREARAKSAADRVAALVQRYRVTPVEAGRRP